MNLCKFNRIENTDDHVCSRCGRVVKNVPSGKIRFHCRLQTDSVQEAAAASKAPGPQGGPGSELKGLLVRVGIVATPDCPCNRRERQMDRQGAAWCRENLDVIVDWLREEAERRKLPFSEKVAAMVVRWAIRRAEKTGDRPADSRQQPPTR